MSSRAELDDYFERVPEHVVTVLDQAYFEYIDDPDYADGIAEYFKSGRSVVVLRTFSKIYGLAGLRVGYGIAPEELVQALGKTRRAFDLATPAQEAALASLDFPDELVRRREANAAGRTELTGILTDAGYRVAGPAVGNFVFADLGEDARVCSRRCSAKASSFVPSPGSAPRRRSGSRWARRRSTRSSRRRWSG